MSSVVSRWQNWSSRLELGSLSRCTEFHTAAMALSEETFAELSKFYETAAGENHLNQVNAWLKSCDGVIPMSAQERAIRNLVIFFAYLAKTWGRLPFTSQVITSDELLPPRPDWSKLPPDLQCLGPPAEVADRFTYVFSDEGRDFIRDSVTPEERQTLSQAADHVRKIGYSRVKTWWCDTGIDIHIEASMIFNLIGVLNALELPYFEPNP